MRLGQTCHTTPIIPTIINISLIGAHRLFIKGMDSLHSRIIMGPLLFPHEIKRSSQRRLPMEAKASLSQNLLTIESINDLTMVAMMARSHMPWGIKDSHS